jgi:hypothetical protein
MNHHDLGSKICVCLNTSVTKVGLNQVGYDLKFLCLGL